MPEGDDCHGNAAWGIGLVMNAWDVYWRREITEHDIQHEMERADRHG